MRIFIPKIFGNVGFALLLSIFLTACNNQPTPNMITVGTIAGPETDLVIAAKEEALKRYGLTIKIMEFSDYNLPNEALETGSLDVNVYQHQPYLNAASKAHNYHLEVIGKTFVYPMGIYAHKIKKIDALKDGSLIALPNDPANETRALLLLEKAGLVTVNASGTTSVKDITSNPHHFKFKEMYAAQLPRILPDVDAAVINTTFALPAGLHPSKDAIFMEDKDSPYANLIVIKKDSPKKDQLLLFVKALNSEAVRKKAKDLFGDDAIAAWESKPDNNTH